MSKILQLGVVGITDGRELAAALEAEAVNVIGFWGEDEAAMAELALFYGVEALPLASQLRQADAFLVGAGLSNPMSTLAALVTADKPLLMTTGLLGRADAIDWLTFLEDASVKAGLALSAVVDDGLDYCRDLVRGGLLGQLLGVEVHVTSESLGDEAWALLGEQLGATLWVTGLMLNSLAVLQTVTANAIYVSALIETTDGAPLSLSLRAAAPGGAHNDLQGPRILGERGQLLLAPKPLGWFTQATESNRSKQWEELVYTGRRGSLARSIDAFVTALQTDEAPLAPLATGIEIARILAALRGAQVADDWLVEEKEGDW